LYFFSLVLPGCLLNIIIGANLSPLPAIAKIIETLLLSLPNVEILLFYVPLSSMEFAQAYKKNMCLIHINNKF
jgi:hypothetical protein